MNLNFEDIYKKYYSSLNKYLFSLTKSEDLAEELTQETFFKALKNISKYNEKYKMLTWLCQIGKNTYYSLYKKNKKIEAFDDSTLSEENVMIDQIIDSETNNELLRLEHMENYHLRKFLIYSTRLKVGQELSIIVQN